MKEIIKTLIVLLLLFSYGCINNETKEKFKDEQKLFSEYKKELKSRKTICEDIVVIDLDKILSSDLGKWKMENGKYECDDKSVTNTVNCNIDKQCSENLFTIDLQLIVDDTSPSPENNNVKRAEWLQKNGKYICYRSTTPHILSRHKITNPYVKIVINMSKSYKLTLKELKDKIEKIGGTGYYNADTYDNYLVFSVSGNNILITLSKEYDPDYICYSVPFFRSIEQIHCMKDDDEISFIPITIDKSPTMAFKIKTKNNDSYYFDYSDEPKFTNNFY